MAVSMRRSTIVNLKHVNELPLRNALESFDKNGDGKIDISELQRMLHWYGLWKHASYGLCLVIMILIWSTFGLTIWAINLTKDYTVTNGVLTGGDEVVKMSVASTYIPLNWATLLDRRHLDALDSLTIDVKQGSGKFSAGIYHMKVASYLHANSTYLKVYGKDGSRVWVNSGTVVLYHPSADEAVMVCGASACNTLAVDVTPEYLQQLVQRSVSIFDSNKNFQLPPAVDGVAINKAEGQGETCQAVSMLNVNSNLDSVAAPVNPQVFSFEVQSQLEGATDVIERNIAQANGHMVGRSSAYDAQNAVKKVSFSLPEHGGRLEKDLVAIEVSDAATKDIYKIVKADNEDFNLYQVNDATSVITGDIGSVSFGMGGASDYLGEAGPIAHQIDSQTAQITANTIANQLNKDMKEGW